MKKIYYEKPECEILVVRFESGILTNSLDSRGYSTTLGGVPTLGDDEDNGSF